jgi:glucose/arabinose dehydrogenase
VGRRASKVLGVAGLAAVGLALLAGLGARAAPRALGLQLVASGLSQPVYVAAPANEPGRLYVVERRGVIWVLVNGVRRAQPFLDIRSRVGSTGAEQGLLSVAFSPSYAVNRRLYVDYTDTAGDTRVVEYQSNGTVALPHTARELLFVDQPFANHNGGQLQFGPDGKLYVGMGDGGSGGDPQNHAQNLTSRLGKLLRTNPSLIAWEVAGYGLRNPWRFSFDRANGDLYLGDVGQGSWEEVDYRPRGAPPANYGWARYEGTHLFKNIQLAGTAPVVFPVREYGHDQGCSVTGGYVYRGSAVPAARGRYFYGDFCSGTVWSVRLGGGVDDRREPFKVSSLSSFGEDAAGELYLVSLGGSIYRLTG